MNLGLLLNAVRFRYVLLLLVGLVVADGLITQFLLSSGMAREGNPFMENLFAMGNFMAIKIAGALLSAVLLAGIYRRHPQMAAVASLCFIAFYTAIVYWNIVVVGLSLVV